METVEMTSAYHHGEISVDELLIRIGEEMEEAQQALLSAIESLRIGSDPSGVLGEPYRKGHVNALDAVLRELGIDTASNQPDTMK
jgi:hypothetical protein